MALSPEEFEAEVQLVMEVQAGDTAAFADLYRRHHSSVRRTCLRQLLNSTEAEEVVQATFVRAFERIDQCSGPRNFGAWVHVIAQRLCVDAIRARQRVSPELAPIDADEAVTGGGSPEDVVIDREDASFMRAALLTLPARQRDVVVARDVDGRRPSEIAAALGISVGAVDSVLLRGRRRLALVYHQLASERGAAAASTSAAASLAGGGVAALEPDGLTRAFSSLLHALARVADLMPSSPVGRKVASAIVGAAMAAMPIAHPPETVHRSPSRTVTSTIPVAPAIPVTTLPEPPAPPPSPVAPVSPALPVAVPVVSPPPVVVAPSPLPATVAPVTTTGQRHSATSDVIAEIERVLGVLHKQ